MKQIQQIQQISLILEPHKPAGFTTLLQSGIYLNAQQGISISELLMTLPGFTKDYISTNIQTIFLNGLPADSMEQKLFGSKAVLALSAAMPGLAGAIFRKGGAHAYLRTKSADKLSGTDSSDQPIQVCLKLFNKIAEERGVQILNDGCIIQASALEKFLAYRPFLLTNNMTITINNKPIESDIFTDFLQSEETISLTIQHKE